MNECARDILCSANSDVTIVNTGKYISPNGLYVVSFLNTLDTCMHIPAASHTIHFFFETLGKIGMRGMKLGLHFPKPYEEAIVACTLGQVDSAERPDETS